MKKCVNCGFESQDGGNFCPSCGGNMMEAEAGTAPVNEVQAPIYYNAPQQEEVSFGDWMLTILLSAIPCVNLIMLFVWAFSGNTKKSKSNWAKANLVYLLISVVISIIVGVIAGIAGASLMNQLYY